MPNIAKEHGSDIPEGYQNLPNSERRPSPGTKLVGPADPGESFSVTIVLRRRPDGPPIPAGDGELRAAWKPQPRMSQDEFAAKYGAAPEDVEMVTQFVKAHGLTVAETHLARRTVVASGTVAQMSKAFAVELGIYEYPAPQTHGEATYRGRDGLIAVPKELAAIILGVFGLDNRRVSQHAGAHGDPPHTKKLTVKKVTELYKFPDPGPAIANQTIGIISPGGNWGYVQSDLDQYFDSVGEKKVKPIDISVAGAVNGAHEAKTIAAAQAGHHTLTFGPTAIPAGFPAGSYAYPAVAGSVPYGNWYPVKTVTRSQNSTTVTLSSSLSVPVPKGTAIYFNVGNETTQDVCVAASAAPGAHIAVYFAPDTEAGWIEVFNRAIWPEQNDFRDGVDPPSVLSCSFSLTQGDDQRGKAYVTLFSISMLDSLFLLDAVVRGVTICAATGDSGSQGSPNLNDGHAHVWYPASDPFVLAVGGTTLGQTESGTWVEYVWNDQWESGGQIQFGATGGGVSDFFGVPTYQNIGVPESVNPRPFQARGRGVPDVAANASPNSAYPMYFCGTPYYAAGTSAATPLWAGLIATINSYRPNPFGNIGWVNPLLYHFALQLNLFNPLNALWRDPHNPNLAACPTNNGFNGVEGYHATAGWDACTGWGSPNGMAVLDMFVLAD
jgi:subtilase family serine protease